MPLACLNSVLIFKATSQSDVPTFYLISYFDTLEFDGKEAISK